MADIEGPVTIKRYGNQRLYHAAAARYVTLDDLTDMIEDDEDFVVRDAHTGDDVTPSVLKQIIVERKRHG
jgi:polyhydroxyalkanoate synthesis repressor PhaR